MAMAMACSNWLPQPVHTPRHATHGIPNASSCIMKYHSFCRDECLPRGSNLEHYHLNRDSSCLSMLRGMKAPASSLNKVRAGSASEIRNEAVEELMKPPFNVLITGSSKGLLRVFQFGLPASPQFLEVVQPDLGELGKIVLLPEQD
eukprot:Gb_26274 [translate_table: standard]